MEEMEEEDNFSDDADDNFSLDEEDEDDDAKDSAFLRGAEEAVQIKDEEEEEVEF